MTLSIPFEVASRIAQHLVQEYAAIFITLLPYRRAGNTTVNLETPIIKRSIKFEGKKYISSVENVNAENSPSNVSESLKRPGVLYISEDYCGITDMLFLNESEPPPAIDHVPGVWWKCLRIEGPETQLTLYGDVSFQSLQLATV